MLAFAARLLSPLALFFGGRLFTGLSRTLAIRPVSGVVASMTATPRSRSPARAWAGWSTVSSLFPTVRPHRARTARFGFAGGQIRHVGASLDRRPILERPFAQQFSDSSNRFRGPRCHPPRPALCPRMLATRHASPRLPGLWPGGTVPADRVASRLSLADCRQRLRKRDRAGLLRCAGRAPLPTSSLAVLNFAICSRVEIEPRRARLGLLLLSNSHLKDCIFMVPGHKRRDLTSPHLYQSRRWRWCRRPLRRHPAAPAR